MPEDSDKPDNQDASTRDQNRPDEPETNPFIAFRRFADEQVSSVLQSITGLPSSIGPPNPDRWTIFTDDQSYKSMAYRHRQDTNGTNQRETAETSDRSAGGNSADDGSGSSGTSSGANDQQPPSTSRNSRQSDEPSSSHSYQSHHLRHDHSPSQFFRHSLPLRSQPDPHFFPMPTPFGVFNDYNDPMWPLNYILTSPYSPLRLQNSAQYDQRRFSRTLRSSPSEGELNPPEPEWREAFEDLLRVENGKPMLNRDDPSALAKRATESEGYEWIRGLAMRGSLSGKFTYSPLNSDGHPPDRLLFPLGIPYSFAGHQPRSETQEAETELDLYDHLEMLDRYMMKERAESSILRSLLELEQQFENSLAPLGSGNSSQSLENEQGTEDTESWLDLVSGGNCKSVPENLSSDEHSVAKDLDTFRKDTPRVVSTMIRTERVLQADGSVETKRVETKRYEDGGEDSVTSVEISNPDKRSQESQSNLSQEGPKGGWFWRE